MAIRLHSTAIRALLVTVALATALAACNSDDGASGAGGGSAFRNLGKRGDSDVAGQAAKAALP